MLGKIILARGESKVDSRLGGFVFLSHKFLQTRVLLGDYYYYPYSRYWSICLEKFQYKRILIISRSLDRKFWVTLKMWNFSIRKNPFVIY